MERIDDKAPIEVTAIYSTESGKRIYARVVVDPEFLKATRSADFVFEDLRRTADEVVASEPYVAP